MIYLCSAPHDGTVKRRETEQEYAKLLLDYALKTEYGIQSYEIVKGKNGKPLFKDKNLHLSISHTNNSEYCRIAVAIAECNIGIDIQCSRPNITRIGKKICTPAEYELYKYNAEELLRIFTVKEAYSKLLGVGLAMGFTKVSAERLRYGKYFNVFEDTACAVFYEKPQDIIVKMTCLDELFV